MSYPMKLNLQSTKIAWLLPLLCLCCTSLFADDFPAKASTLVNDYTGTLSDDERIQLERKLVLFNDSTSTQISIVMMHSVGNYDISDYTVQLYNRWGIGQQNKNNGVLILV